MARKEFDFENADDEDASGAGEVVTKSALAKLSGLSLGTIDRAIAEGAPVIAKGTRRLGWQINSARFMEWYVARQCGAVELDETGAAQLRHMLAVADSKELKRDTMRREIVSVDDVLIVMGEEAAPIRKVLNAIPAAIAAAVAAESDASVVESLLEDAVNDALIKLSADAEPEETEIA
jgi:phage terminase Nu1 subunit (DNA packaging protein)